MRVCHCTGATAQDVRKCTTLGRQAGTKCGGCRPLVLKLRPRK